MRSKTYFTILVFYLLGVVSGFAQTSTSSARQGRSVTIVSEPKAIVWIDDVLRGKTGEGGKLSIKPVTAGAHKLRVRADGFKEVSQNLLATQKGEVKVALVKTADPAELSFQEAENLTTVDREKSVAAYRKAIGLRPKYAEAQLGLARVLLAMNKIEDALTAIKEARKARPGYAEASAVEGRIYVEEGDEEKAIASFKRSIAEGKGFQPEAQTGLGLLYKGKAEAAGAGDAGGEEENYTIAIGHFKKAVAQLSGAPDAITLYQFLGMAYEKMKKYDEAIRVYEEFLRVFPESNEATAVQSFIVQLKKEMSEQ